MENAISQKDVSGHLDFRLINPNSWSRDYMGIEYRIQATGLE